MPHSQGNAAERVWTLRPSSAEHVRALADALHCPEPVATILASRSILPGDLRVFLEPTFEDLHNPESMLGIVAAVCRIEQAVAAREPILIYGDYDVDGTTATVLLKTGIDRLSPGQPSLVTWHVPHRIREGYGMQASRLAEAAAAGIRLVISVDTGIRAFAAADEAAALGLDLIVTDHHLPDDLSGIPNAVAVINPQQPGCPYPFKELCGAAVAFKLAHALLLRAARQEADVARALDVLARRIVPSLLKLVAIATIADSVPLVGENRTIATLGLRELARPVQPGLRALMEVADLPLDRAPSASDVGFRLGPRINAAGRMDIADDVIALFLTRSPETARHLAQKLNDLNEERRATERAALEAIEGQLAALLEAHGEYPPECLILDHADWHRGVLGILASRVVERTGRPALVLTHLAGEAHGSGRSVLGFHLLDALTAAHTPKPELGQAGGEALLLRFGGHAHAVGLTLRSENLDLLRQRMREVCVTRLGQECLTPPLMCDSEVGLSDLTRELSDWLVRCAPFGNANPEPVLMTRRLELSAPPRLIKDRHICLCLANDPGGPKIQAMGWSRKREWVERIADLQLGPGSRVDLAFRLRWKESQWFTGLELELVGLRLS